MKRFSIAQHYNVLYLIPTVQIYYEKNNYMYICVSWLKWIIDYRVYDETENV
jgi:hypothetical protein